MNQNQQQRPAQKAQAPRSEKDPTTKRPATRAKRPETKRPAPSSAAKARRTESARPTSEQVKRTRPEPKTERSGAPTVVLGGVPIVEEKKRRLFFLPASDAPSVRTIKAKSKTPFPVSSIFAIVLCTGLFLYMIANFVQINEYSLKLDQMQNELSELSSMQQNLELQLEDRNDMSAISKIAEEELGMVKMDEVEKIYLDGSSEDKIEISKNAGEGTTEVSPLSMLLSAIAQNFKDFAEYID